MLAFFLAASRGYSTGCKKSNYMWAFENMTLLLTRSISTVNSFLISLQSQSLVKSALQLSMMFILWIMFPFRVEYTIQQGTLFDLQVTVMVIISQDLQCPDVHSKANIGQTELSDLIIKIWSSISSSPSNFLSLHPIAATWELPLKRTKAFQKQNNYISTILCEQRQLTDWNQK